MAVVVDFPATGEIIDSQGAIQVLRDQMALENAINLWISSFQGERLYQPTVGGVVIDNLLKPMSNDRANEIRSEIMDGLAYQFKPSVKVSECIVFPDYERDTYWISVKGYCPSLQVSIYNKIGLKPII